LDYVYILSINNEIISLAADIYSDLRKKGITVGDADIFISSIVIHNNGTLISNNTKHYENINNLKLENWI
jgi:predicted nucleic acid-binding protein